LKTLPGCRTSFIPVVTLCTKLLVGGKVRILGDGSFGYCEKKLLMNVCLILNGYRDRVV